jgi:molybdenum cofactor synthesis domain-containing protein
MMQVGILTVSDRAYAKKYDDQSGPIIQSMIEDRLGWKVAQIGIVPDEREYIKSELIRWVDDLHLNLILTTGGTGFSPRDITPEATHDIIEREAPGLAEAMRAESMKITPHAMLSRGVCGLRGQALIINLPGSPKAVSENMDVLIPVLPHALDLLTGSPDAESGHMKA